MAEEETKKYEPKSKNRWLLEIDGIDSYLIRKASRPVVWKDPAGKHHFAPLIVKVYDTIRASSAHQVHDWLEKGDTKTLVLKLLSPVGEVIETWSLFDAELTMVDFGELDYASIDPLTITMTIKYHRYELS